jgi:hypothetical protein
MMIVPEIYAHADCGILINAVDAFRRSVKTTMARAREPAMTSGRYLWSEPADRPTMIGSRGEGTWCEYREDAGEKGDEKESHMINSKLPNF